MSTIISSSIIIKAENIGNGCNTFQIYSGSVSSSDALIGTASKSVLLNGYEVTGSNLTTDYLVVCLDENEQTQTKKLVSDCSGSSIVNLPPKVCPEPQVYNGNQVFPAIYIVDLGFETGSVDVEYQTYSIPDRIEVYWSGSKVIDTGYVGRDTQTMRDRLSSSLADYGIEYDENDHAITDHINLGNSFSSFAGHFSQSFDKYSAEPLTAQVKVYGPDQGTAWVVTVYCPDTGSAVVPPTASAPPTTSSCAGWSGTGLVTANCTAGDQATFTVNSGYSVTVAPEGYYYDGIIANYGENLGRLYSNDGTLLEEWFQQTPQPGTTRFSLEEGSYTPSTSYTITSPGTYKIQVGNKDGSTNFNNQNALNCIGGQGTFSLSITNCVENESFETGVKHTALRSGTNRVKVVWPQTDSAENYEKAIDAQDLMEFFTNRTSTAQYTWFYFKSNLVQSGGFKIFDVLTEAEVGDVNLTSNSQVRWWNETPTANEVVIEMKNVSDSGDISAGTIPVKLYKFRAG